MSTDAELFLVLIKRDGSSPWDVTSFGDFMHAMDFHDLAAIQWSDVYLVRVIKGPRDTTEAAVAKIDMHSIGLVREQVEKPVMHKSGMAAMLRDGEAWQAKQEDRERMDPLIGLMDARPPACPPSSSGRVVGKPTSTLTRVLMAAVLLAGLAVALLATWGAFRQ